MEVVYPILLIIHLFCAIIFLGYIFCDVVLLGLVRKHLGDSWADKTWSVVSPRATKIMPICLLVLVITGFGMITQYIKFSQGYEAFFVLKLQTLLTIKMILALSIFLALGLTTLQVLSAQASPRCLRTSPKSTTSQNI